MPEVDRPILFDQEALIASLANDERFLALQQAAEEAEEEKAAWIARLLLHSKKEFDPILIAQTRGYLQGARYWTSGRVALAQQRLAQRPSQETKESD